MWPLVWSQGCSQNSTHPVGKLPLKQRWWISMCKVFYGYNIKATFWSWNILQLLSSVQFCFSSVILCFISYYLFDLCLIAQLQSSIIICSCCLDRWCLCQKSLPQNILFHLSLTSNEKRTNVISFLLYYCCLPTCTGKVVFIDNDMNWVIFSISEITQFMSYRWVNFCHCQL